jgi:hypothetical protein
MTSRLRGVWAVCAALWAGAAVLVGCQDTSTRSTNTAADTARADADRTTLSRFVGAWKFEGWSAQAGGTHQASAGRAAGTIENERFVLLDLQATSGQLAGPSTHKSGSMLLASEPGIGITMTAWGDASPSISRLVGHVEGSGSRLVFDESRTPSGVHRVSLLITLQNADRWVAEVRDTTASTQPLIASYTFTRAAP